MSCSGDGLFAKGADEFDSLLGRPDWATSLGERLGPELDGNSLWQVIGDRTSAAWQVLLPPLSGRRILYVAAHAGCEALALSSMAGSVVALESDAGHAAFLKARARSLGVANLEVRCTRSAEQLPFPDGGFDAVILNGLDWWRPASTRAAQVASLREALRVLAPDGHLWLSAENRWGYPYWFGFYSFLPRAIGNMWAGLRGRGPHAPSHGHRGYRRLLRDAGFADQRFYAAWPDYRHPTVLVSLEMANQSGPMKPMSARGRLRRRLACHRTVTPTYGIVAGRARAEESLVMRIVEHSCAKLGISRGPGFPRVQASGATTAGLVVFVEDTLVIRLPLEPANAARVENNYTGLQYARELRGRVAMETPEPLLSETYESVFYTVESRVPGAPLDSIASEVRRSQEERAFDLLLRLQSSATAVAVEDGTLWNATVVEPLGRAMLWGRSKEERSLIGEVAAMALDADHGMIPRSLIHGDFHLGNMLVTGAERDLAVIDWDRWSRRDLITHDFLHFVIGRRADGRATWSRLVAAWVAGEGADKTESEWTRRFEAAAGLDFGWRVPAILSYWARTTAVMAGTDFDLKRNWIETNFLTLLPDFHALLRSHTARP